jgi:hypothetical protein
VATGETGFDNVSFDLISVQYHSLKAGRDYGSTWDCTLRRHPQVDSRDVDAIQHDESLTAADRVDLIANRVVSERDDTPEVDEKH